MSGTLILNRTRTLIAKEALERYQLIMKRKKNPNPGEEVIIDELGLMIASLDGNGETAED